jgi:catechol 2,3-dioxygenase-like lactoylglutathione lyase family enzyme
MTTSPGRLSHVVLNSPDPKRLMEWYCEALGGEIIFDSPFFVFMTYDEEHHRVAAMLSPAADATKTPGTGLMHMAFGFDSPGELLDHYERIKGLGHKPASAIHHGPTISFYYKDVDGNVVEFFVDALPVDEATAYMKGPLYAANPVGYEIEPEDLAAQRARGASDAEIMAFDSEKEVDVMATLSRQMELLN